MATPQHPPSNTAPDIAQVAPEAASTQFVSSAESGDAHTKAHYKQIEHWQNVLPPLPTVANQQTSQQCNNNSNRAPQRNNSDSKPRPTQAPTTPTPVPPSQAVKPVPDIMRHSAKLNALHGPAGDHQASGKQANNLNIQMQNKILQVGQDLEIAIQWLIQTKREAKQIIKAKRAATKHKLKNENILKTANAWPINWNYLSGRNTAPELRKSARNALDYNDAEEALNE